MSVLIKGMEMPKNCAECPVNLYVCQRGYEYLLEHPELYDRRADDCPISYVPPHGRCIDADELAKTLGITDMDCYKCAWGNHGFCGRGGDFNDACEAIEDASTIIPPSEEGE